MDFMKSLDELSSCSPILVTAYIIMNDYFYHYSTLIYYISIAILLFSDSVIKSINERYIKKGKVFPKDILLMLVYFTVILLSVNQFLMIKYGV